MRKQRLYTCLLLFSFIVGSSSSFSQAKKVVDQQIEDSVKLDELTRDAWSSYKKNPDQTLKTMYKALSLAKKHGNEEEEANCYNTISVIYSETGQYDSSLYYSEKYLNFGLEKNDSIIISVAYGNMGLSYAYQGIHDSALVYDFKALSIYDQLNNPYGIAGSYVNIGNTYIRLKSNKDAIDYLNKALSSFQEMEDKEGIAYSLTSLANVYSETDSLRPVAMNYYQQALKLVEELNDRFGIANTLKDMASLYEKEKDYEKVFELLNEVLAINRELGNQSGTTKTLIKLGNVSGSMQKYNDAFPYLIEALGIAEETGNIYDKQQVYLALAKANASVHNYKLAYEYDTLYSQISKTILNKEKLNQIIEVETKYETDKKQQENELLFRDNEIKALEIERQANQRTALIIAFAFVVIAGFLVFNRMRLKQQNRILQEKKLRASAVFQTQEKEKIHLSKELHDGIGPLLSLIKLTITSLKKDASNEKVINDIKDIASKGLKEVRNISHTLMPSLLEKKGLEPALKEFANQINGSNTLKVELTYSVTSELTQDMELNIYRIIQETLQNVIKHADATLATVKFNENENVYQLVLSDNGKGFDIVKTSAGNGLINIQSRVDFLNGKIKMTSEIQKGTRFIIQIPKT